MNDKLQKIISRVNQLRAISRSTHSKAEAETTLALAAKLIAEYQLSEAQIEAETGKTDDPIDLESEHIIYESGRITPWKSELSVGIAKLNGLFIYNALVRGVESHRKRTRYRIIGKKSNIAIAMYMWQYLLDEISQLVNDYVPGGKKRGVNPEKESWCLGCVRGFLDKMNREKQQAMQQATSTAMVLVSNQAKEAEEAFLTKTGISIRKNTYQSKARVTDTFYSGYRKGQTLSVNPGMNGGAESKKLGG